MLSVPWDQLVNFTEGMGKVNLIIWLSENWLQNFPLFLFLNPSQGWKDAYPTELTSVTWRRCEITTYLQAWVICLWLGHWTLNLGSPSGIIPLEPPFDKAIYTVGLFTRRVPKAMPFS